MSAAATAADLARIEAALDRAADVLRGFDGGTVDVQRKGGGDPVSDADRAVDAVLREALTGGRDDEGWLSEETHDDRVRLRHRRVWIVDPIDGTKYFLSGRPEWCVSVGLAIDGVAVAGGLLNPAAGQRITGGIGCGVRLDGEATRLREVGEPADLELLCSPTEIGRPEWRGGAFAVRPVGSIAWKLGLVAAGRADATWTLRPRHEWDVAGGAALVRAAGGVVWEPGHDGVALNRADPRVAGVVGCSTAAAPVLARWLARFRG